MNGSGATDMPPHGGRRAGDRTVFEAGDGPASFRVTLSPAAIGNAIFDATGARLREIP